MNTLLFDKSFDRWPGRMVRSLRRMYNDQCITILTYHSISREESVFTRMPGMRHHPADFEREVDYLAAHFNVISLSTLVQQIEGGERPRRAVVITLDDGFADAIRVAAPIMFRRRLPMTIFPATAMVGNHDLMWQHKLAWLIASGHEERVWDALAVHGFPSETERPPLNDFVRLHYRYDIHALLEDVLRSVGVNGAALAERYRPYVDEEDLAQADPEFIEFGNHTDSHPILSALTSPQQLAEIGIARRKLQAWTGRAPLAFAYPFGLKRHYTETTRELAIESGHRAVLDMRRRINVDVTNGFDLSRKPGPCASQIEFEKMIEAWPANARLSPPEGVRDGEY